MRIERKTAGSVTILACAGTLDDYGMRALGEKTGAVVGAGCHRLVVNFGEMNSFNSTLLANLITASHRMKAVAGELVVAAAPSPLQKTIETLGLNKMFKFFPDDRAALAYFGEEGGDFTGSGGWLEPPRPSDSAGA